MIIVNIEVPMLGKDYDFQMDESVLLGEAADEIVETICQKEQCVLEGEKEELLLWNKENGSVLSPNLSAGEYGLLTGSRLLLI